MYDTFTSKCWGWPVLIEIHLVPLFQPVDALCNDQLPSHRQWPPEKRWNPEKCWNSEKRWNHEKQTRWNLKRPVCTGLITILPKPPLGPAAAGLENCLVHHPFTWNEIWRCDGIVPMTKGLYAWWRWGSQTPLGGLLKVHTWICFFYNRNTWLYLRVLYLSSY